MITPYRHGRGGGALACRTRALGLRTAACRAGLLAALIFGINTAWAEARFAGLFGDHMVLQRDSPIRIWGTANPGEAVTVSLHGRQRGTRAGANGRWTLDLPTMPAGGPHTLSLRSPTSQQVLNDVLVGEVWICAGQSNMEWLLSGAQGGAAEVAAAGHPGIRHVKLAHRIALRPSAELEPQRWDVSEPGSAGNFSAVGYFFARRLQRELGVPVGLVNVAWGGTHIETWTSPRAAMADPDLASIVQTLPGSSADLAAAQAALAASLIARFQPGLPPADRSPADWSGEAVDDRSWPGLDVPRVWEEQGLPGFDGVVWYRRRVTLTAEQAAGQATLHLGTIDDCDDSFVNGRRVGGDCVWNAARHHPVPAGLLHEGDNLIAVRVTDTGGPGGFYGDAAAVRLETQAGDLRLSGRWRARIEAPQLRDRLDADDAPTLLFNAMVQPLLPLRIRGVLWYQGESNVPRAARYAGAFQRLIRDWRAQWGEGDFPFYFVQLASYLPLEKNSAIGSEWAELRDAQRQALKLPNTGMVVATDIGDASDIHPRNKRAVGDRLADIALHDLHGRRAIVSRGPDYRAMRRVDAAIELRFANPGRGLAVRGGDRVALQGFAIADASRRFRPARATLHGDRVIVASDEVSNPVAVRYGWVDNPEQANLINREGLPASPFRTDDWPLLTEGGRFRP